MFDSRKIFLGKEKNYDKNRPAYPTQLISFLYDTIGFSESSVIADIGSGTGIFSKQIAERRSTVICVEPNNDMRQIARKNWLNIVMYSLQMAIVRIQGLQIIQ